MTYIYALIDKIIMKISNSIHIHELKSGFMGGGFRRLVDLQLIFVDQN